MKIKVCIIGGKGRMGSAFARMFGSKGHEVLVVDRPPQSPAAPYGGYLPLERGSLDSNVRVQLEDQQAVSRADVVLFAVPISVTVDAIRGLAPLAKERSLLCDITSIKGPAVQAMIEAAPPSCEILGLHPMCGPGGIDDLTGQVVAVCGVREAEQSSFLLRLLTDLGAVLKRTTAEQHDKIMAVVQGLTHVSAIAGGMALQALGVDLDEALAFSSPIYKLRFGMIGRVLSQDPRLYGEIQMKNPESVKATQMYLSCVADLVRKLEENDESGFEDRFRGAADYLGYFTGQSREFTDRLIQWMAHNGEH